MASSEINEERAAQAYTRQEDRCVTKAAEPKPWTNLERAADRLKSAQDALDRWESALNTVKSAWAAARTNLGEAQNHLRQTALGLGANLPE